MGARMTPLECLVLAIRLEWSGCIQVYENGERVGQIMLGRGRIAWAIFRGQSESLGMFLWRLGRITREQLDNVTAIYRRHDGKKKLGAILEESGFMSRPVLQRCLLLHIRSALDGLLTNDEHKSSEMAKGPEMDDEPFMFTPSEVLPPHVLTEIEHLAEELDLGNPRETWHTLNRNNLALRPFTDLSGYLAAAVYSFDGDVVLAHNTGATTDLAALGVIAAAVLDAGVRAAGSSALGELGTVALSCDQGLLSATWLDTDRYYFVCLLTQGDQDPRSVDRHLAEFLPDLRRYLLPAQTVAEPRAQTHRVSILSMFRGVPTFSPAS
jgi:hypothetical protein